MQAVFRRRPESQGHKKGKFVNVWFQLQRPFIEVRPLAQLLSSPRLRVFFRRLSTTGCVHTSIKVTKGNINSNLLYSPIRPVSLHRANGSFARSNKMKQNTKINDAFKGILGILRALFREP